MKQRSVVNVMFAVVFLFSAGLAAAKTIYVKSTAAGSNTGASWTDAYKEVRSALAAAKAGDEVWVAAGTYKPTSGTDQGTSFALVAGVTLYGGFAGTESSIADRNWWGKKSTLSGDIGVTSNSSDNCYHVVRAASNATLDGFWITGGNTAAGNGAAVWVNNTTSTTLVNCIFEGNSANSGGAVYAGSAALGLKLKDCLFRTNSAKSGGGLYVDLQGNPNIPRIIHCEFYANSATNGGGLYLINNPSANIEITNSSFGYNSATNGGGALCLSSSSSNGQTVSFTDCEFRNNSVSDSGNGGAVANNSFNTCFTDCDFNANSAADEGGAIYCGLNPYSTNIIRCVFNSNTSAVSGGAIANRGVTSASNCIVVFNSSRNGAGLYNGGNLTLSKCAFCNNTASESGGSAYNAGAFARVTNCAFGMNVAKNYGCGFDNESSATLTNCTLSSNLLTGDSSQGGGVFNGDTATHLRLTNTILWGNIATSSQELRVSPSLTVYQSIDHSDVKGCGGSGAAWTFNSKLDGGGNIDADPIFVGAIYPFGPDLTLLTDDDGLLLGRGSACINKGCPTLDTDILDTARSGVTDIGAYEYHPPKNNAPRWSLYR